MPLSLRRGTVSAVLEELDGLIRLEVDGVSCVAYPRADRAREVGDEVLVNVQARELGLGSGGFDVVHANLTRGLGLDSEPGAHVMVLPYTPLQYATRHVEEDGPLADDLAGLPVVCCTLHSQLAPAAPGWPAGELRSCRSGGALPVSLSDTVRVTHRARAGRAAIGVGPCFGGDLQAVSTVSALAWVSAGGLRRCRLRGWAGNRRDRLALRARRSQRGARGECGRGARGRADARGPGLVRRPARAASGRLASHAGRARAVQWRATVAWPAGLDLPGDIGLVEEVDVDDWREACEGLPLEHMGRGPDDDPWFFAAAFAAGRLAARQLG